MIAGRIVVHTEPQRYRTSKTNAHNNWQQDFVGYGGDLDGNWWGRRFTSSSLTLKNLQDIIKSAALDGYVEGARVSRSSGNPGIGTITKIFDSYQEALDEDLNEFCPFQVTWDKTEAWPAGGKFTYPKEDLKVISTPLPPLEGTNNETVSDLSVSC